MALGPCLQKLRLELKLETLMCRPVSCIAPTVRTWVGFLGSQRWHVVACGALVIQYTHAHSRARTHAHNTVLSFSLYIAETMERSSYANVAEQHKKELLDIFEARKKVS